MKVLREFNTVAPDFRGGAVTIGNFDGVHRGHAKIIERLTHYAAQVGGPSVVFTFEPHPVKLLRPEAAPARLTSTRRKAELLAQLGVDILVAWPTTNELLLLSPEDFFQQIMVDGLGAKAVVEGPNFHFGRNRQGDVGTLARLCEQANMQFEIRQPLTDGGEYISSSRVRDHIRQGEISSANGLLTQPYQIQGEVVAGEARGRTIGFPTANLGPVSLLLPAPGVYAGVARVGEQSYPAAVNIGARPTFGEEQLKVEAHLVGFQGDLYGDLLVVDLLARLRDIQPFDSIEMLKQQLAVDVDRTCRLVESYLSTSTK